MENKKVDKKKAIMDTTINLMSTQGFHKTSMSQIIKEASVGAGTLYNYFDSKETLINEIVLEIKSELADLIYSQYSPENSFEENFKNMWFAIWDNTFQNRERTYFAEMFIRSPYIKEETFKKIYTKFSMQIGFLYQSIEKGYIDKMPLELLESYLFGPIYHLLKLNMTQISSNPELQKEKMFNICCKSLLTKKSKI